MSSLCYINGDYIIQENKRLDFFTIFICTDYKNNIFKEIYKSSNVRPSLNAINYEALVNNKNGWKVYKISEERAMAEIL